MKESIIQKHIIEYLTIQEKLGNLTFFRNNSFAGSFTRPNGSNGFIRNNKAGVADIFVLKKGIAYSIEVKAEKGKQSDKQIKYQELWEKCGGKYYVVRSLDELTKIL